MNGTWYKNFLNSYTNTKSEIRNSKQVQISKFKCSKVRFKFWSFVFRNCPAKRGSSFLKLQKRDLGFRVLKLEFAPSRKILVERLNRALLSFTLSFLILFFISCSQKEERIKSARKFIGEWNYDRALTEIIAHRNENDAEIQYLLGYCYLKKNEFGEAAVYFEKSLAITDGFKDSILELYTIHAENALRINEAERALFLYQEVAKLIPEYDQANNLFLVGDMNFEKGNYPAAVVAYRRALEIDSISPTAKAVKHKLITALKESDSLTLALQLATEEYEKLKTAANLLQLSEIQFALGSTLFNEGQFDSAMIFFGNITASQEPKSLLDDAYFYCAEIYLKKENFSAALEAYKKVLRLNPYEKGEIVKKAKERIQEIKKKL